MINYNTQSVRASENEAGWHQKPIYHANKSKCNHKKNRLNFVQENLSALALAERFSVNKFQRPQYLCHPTAVMGIKHGALLLGAVNWEQQLKQQTKSYA